MVNIVILGVGKVGCVVSKEITRYLSCYNEPGNYRLVLVDNAEVKAGDILTQPFIDEDISWNKAACMKAALTDIYPDMSQNIEAFDIDISEDKYIEKKSFYNYISDMYVIVDCIGSRKSSEGIKSFCQFLNEKKANNSFIIYPTAEGIDTAVTMMGYSIKEYKPIAEGMPDNFSDCVTLGHMMTEELIQIINDKKMVTEERNLLSLKDYDDNEIVIPDKPKLMVCVGAGGTGGSFVKECAKELLLHDNTYLLVIDGDRVEEKNCSRQPFSEEDIQQNKASVLVESLICSYPELNGRMFSFPAYLEDVSDLEDAIKSTGLDDTYICLTGCVDNHRARQVLLMYYAQNDDVLYVDSGNEFDFGQVVVSVKKGGKQLSPTVAHYFKEVLTDNSPSVSELSCGVVNESAPQHQITNLSAADIILQIYDKLFEEGVVNGGIVYFGVFDHYRSFRAFEMEGVSHARI